MFPDNSSKQGQEYDYTIQYATHIFFFYTCDVLIYGAKQTNSSEIRGICRKS